MPVPLTAEQYRKEAKRVRRIAEASIDESLREELFRIAEEFEALGGVAKDSEPDSA